MRRFVFSLAVAALAAAASAQVSGRPTVGARAAALGTSFAAVADNGDAAYWNPAGLTALGSHELHSTTVDLYGTGLRSNYLVYALPITDRVSAGAYWLDTGFDDDELEFSQGQIGLASGVDIIDGVALGVGLKRHNLTSRLIDLASPADFSSEGTGWGFDVGLLVRPLPLTQLALVWQDAGDSRVSYGNGVDRVIYPQRFLFGASHRVTRDLLLSGSVDDAGHVAAEYRVLPALALRGGLQRDFGDAAGVGLNAGLGLRYRFGQLDYAFTDTPGLGATHRFSLAFAFNISASAIKIRDPELPPVFPSLQKIYETDPVGHVQLTNTSRKPLQVEVSFFAPEAMSQPTVVDEVVLAPGTATIDLHALFGAQLSHWQRNRMVPAEVQVSYTDGSRTRTTRKQTRLTVYKRNAIHWREIGVAAAFITADDEAVSTFASGVLQPLTEEIRRGGRSSRPLLRAMVLFDALGVYGVRYLADANTPYDRVHGQEYVVDSISYPAQLLAKRTGDCDDATVLYCSLLEYAGIQTALVDAPGHILMAFDTGVDSDGAEGLGLPRGTYLVRDGGLWIPVEVTLFGRSFHEAWSTAAMEVRQLEAQGRLIVEDTRTAWRNYPPSPPQFDLVVVPPPAAEMGDMLAADWNSIESLREDYLESSYLASLRREPDNQALRGALVYNLLEIGQYDRALSELDTLAVQEAPVVTVGNNRAIVYAMKGDLGRAEMILQEVLAVHPDDTHRRRLT